MRFFQTAHAGLADGSITVTFRRWRRTQVRVGGVYRIGPVDLTVDRIRRVPIDRISERDARRAGFADRAALVAFLGPPRADATEELIWRIDFHCEPATAKPVPSGKLTPDDVDELRRRLDRLDANGPTGSTGPWTRAVLELIARRPGVVSTELATELGRERAPFKIDVRKLKRLGLTESLEVGYRLSRRGKALLRRLG
ncbi:MAG: hypothetical protein ACXW2Y_06910 [Acidimicrobiia bacterium]